MVGKGREHSAAPSSEGGGMGTSIPADSLRRALLSSLHTPVAASSSTPVRGGRGKKRGSRGGRGGRGGRGKGRVAATPSSPPPPADSPEHRTARVDPSEDEATRTPVHEPRVDEPSTYTTPVPEASSHETPEQSRDEGTSRQTPWDTWPEEPSGHADGGGDRFSDSDEELPEGATVYQRGMTRLPPVPATRELRWLIRPDGERGWHHPKDARRPNSILGVLVRQNFPGFVTLPGEGQVRELGLTWEHYLAAPAPPEERIDGVLCHTRAEMVIRHFWTFYRCEEGYEEAAAKVIDQQCKRLLQNFRHEARVQAVRDYYASRRIRKEKSTCRGKKMEKEHYMKVPPRWCADMMDCWEALVDEWCSEQWLSVHNNAKDRRNKMVGVPHHQGSANLNQFGLNWAHHNKTEVPQMYDLYAMAHTASYKKVKAFSESDLDDPLKFSNISSHNKLVRYRDEGKARKGEDFNPSQEPIDPELVMIAGGGRPHGSIAIGDGLIRCPSNLREIKARQTSSCPEIRPRPRPVELAIEAAIQKEREATQALMAAKEKEMEERTARLCARRPARPLRRCQSLPRLQRLTPESHRTTLLQGSLLQVKPVRATAVPLLRDDEDD